MKLGSEEGRQRIDQDHTARKRQRQDWTLEPLMPRAMLFPPHSTGWGRINERPRGRWPPKQTCDAGATVFLIICRCPPYPTHGPSTYRTGGAKGSTPFVSLKPPSVISTHQELQHLPPSHPQPCPGRGLPERQQRARARNLCLGGGAHSRWGTPDCVGLHGGQ